MGMLAWVMMGLALWHFTIWLPDRFWGGIVGAFVGALIGAIVFGLIVNGGAIPGRHATDLVTALLAASSVGAMALPSHPPCVLASNCDASAGFTRELTAGCTSPPIPRGSVAPRA